MIPVSRPRLEERDVELVTRCLREGWVSSSGPWVASFEDRWAEYCSRRHGIAVASGTAALELAVAALELEPGDEVVMPSLTIVSCALAVVRNGGVPVLVDCDPATWCVDAPAAEAAIGPRTRAIMPVHHFGHPADLEPLLRAAAEADLAVIEDAAQAHGAEYLVDEDGGEPIWRRCGSLGTIGVFSFYANKLVTTGEGGMLVCDDDAIAARARSLRDLAHDPQRRFRHDRMGYNHRLSSLQAALGLAQIERLGQAIRAHRDVAARYRERLATVPGLRLPVEATWARSVYWMFGVVLEDDGLPDASEVIAALGRRGIDARPFFLGLHAQPCLSGRVRVAGPMTVTERLSSRGLYLPSAPDLSDAEVDAVVDGLRAVLA
ncbi:MAG TPA: DegT/DnrJ/EryC1/StrS family aminotransferase [Solirubrobacteraceae bacterium]|nr:DegT/DnrJ/EryC1/StrS family aminotransferase [Solirubrobacteraceae bacterium]